jgi:creatinine amidohydrolase
MILEEMTTDEVEAALATCRSVIIPFGVMEAHGPHLPLATDTIQAYDAARRAAQLTPVFVAPPVPYGYCRSLAGHPGTISVSAETMRLLTRDLLRSLYAQGFRNFILYSGHASSLQMAALEEGADGVLAECPDANVAIVLEYDALLKGAAKLIETPGDMHAGEIETSRIMAARPELVREEKLPEASGRQSARPILVRDLRRYWPSSVLGAPRKASAEKGELLGQVAADYLAELVKRLEAFKPH